MFTQSNNLGANFDAFASVQNPFEFYRPRTKYGKGNVFTGVFLSTGGGGGLPWEGVSMQTPLEGKPHLRRQTPSKGRPLQKADPLLLERILFDTVLRLMLMLGMNSAIKMNAFFKC